MLRGGEHQDEPLSNRCHKTMGKKITRYTVRDLIEHRPCFFQFLRGKMPPS
ncbi:MAG: hypothetical protein JWO94_513 [Verrucomicrobiaceae bacterium]|nr:hypothetical protein [Verrucomicrobiaceae bacterium]